MADNEPIVIRPRQAPLSTASGGAPHSPAADASTPGDASVWRQRLLLGALAAALGAALFAVFFVLPGRVNVATEVAAPPAPAAVDAGAAPAADATAPSPAPFRDLQLERAREQATEELSGFVELQIELEDSMQVGDWGADDYAAIKDQASAGDELFQARDFEAALQAYAAATTALETLRQRGEQRYSDGLSAGLAALRAFDQPQAEFELGKALSVKPEDSAALDALRRAQALPEIQRGLREGRQLRRRGDLEGAAAAYAAVRAIDPDTPGLDDAVAAIAVDQEERTFQQALSSGFAALEAGRYQTARTQFNAALRMRPGDAVASGGLQQIAQETEVKGLRALERRAADAAAEERWADALSAYEEALQQDANLQFAVDGRREANERLRISRALATIVSQAEQLSDDKRMRQAEALVQRASALPSSGPQWAAALSAARATLAAHRSPVPVVLNSDNTTEITVYRVGRLGAFTSRELQLRPGRYTIVGSRDGCQDVRKEVLVTPDMAPIDIRCESRL